VLAFTETDLKLRWGIVHFYPRKPSYEIPVSVLNFSGSLSEKDVEHNGAQQQEAERQEEGSGTQREKLSSERWLHDAVQQPKEARDA
jgi:hypothetical protein